MSFPDDQRDVLSRYAQLGGGIIVLDLMALIKTDLHGLGAWVSQNSGYAIDKIKAHQPGF
ncbi:hypothetical protein CWO91_21280 [Bradyrhizobium genosp. SA-3]|nr:hypothetical protein CWO91_21280 [Bradyrhizobium genosp. SA-3]